MRVARPLTADEVALARSVYGDAIDYAPVRVVHGKWVFFQPRDTVMAPRGHIHFHPRGSLWSDNFAAAPLDRQGLFIHEMCLCLLRCRSGVTTLRDAQRHHLHSLLDRPQEQGDSRRRQYEDCRKLL